MSGLSAFLRKELRETLHTWRLWVLPGLLVFLGVTSPVITALTPKILQLAAKSSPGTIVTVATPTARDAYLQFVGNLGQLALLAIIITVSGAISGEVRSGTAALVLTKPISRAAFVIGKAATAFCLVLVSTAVGSVVCIGITAAIFGLGPAGHFVAAVAIWLAYALLFVGIMVALSARLRSQMAAAAYGVGIFAALAALDALPTVRDYQPGGLSAAMSDLLRHGRATWGWPLLTALVLTAIALLTAVSRFDRREL
jgi:ABC-2 type transport system permease protein